MKQQLCQRQGNEPWRMKRGAGAGHRRQSHAPAGRLEHVPLDGSTIAGRCIACAKTRLRPNMAH